MYTIRTAAARAGVSTEAIRAWERRYGVVSPKRSDNGYRVYDDDAIARLVTMRRLIDNGWSAGLAAQHVIENGPELSATAVIPGPARLAQTQGADEDLVAAFVAAAAALDNRAVARVLDEMFTKGTFESVVENHLFPALRALGDAWEAGRVTVAAEHAASYAVARRLAAAMDAAGLPTSGEGGVIVGLAPGARHELGAMVFATVAQRAGLAVTYLGADLPEDDWVAAAEHADAAVLPVVVEADIAPSRAVVQRLRRTYPRLVIALGGPMAPRGAGHLWLPDGPVQAVAVLKEELAQR